MSAPGRRRPHVLMIDSNNNVPQDRRVWLECRALADAGISVTVICPGPPDAVRTEYLDGVVIHRYPLRNRNARLLGYVSKYIDSWLRTLALTIRVHRRHPFDVIQACNPPDTYYLIARAFRRRGVRFLFDQHDLCPEIYRDRSGRSRSLTLRALAALERWSHDCADHVITVNESCRELLLARTSTRPADLTVVRTGPDLVRLRPGAPLPRLRHGRTHLCAYLGIMGRQDNVELVLRALEVIVHDLRREDVHVVLMGDGECLPALRRLAADLEIEPWVTFTGFADDATVSGYLSTSDLGLQPDGRTPFTDLCSMVKTIEYMAFGLPVVAFDLLETRRTAGEAGHYVTDETPQAFARVMVDLLDDPARRAAMSQHARRRAEQDLAWQRWQPVYLDVVRGLLPVTPSSGTEGRPRSGTPTPARAG